MAGLFARAARRLAGMSRVHIVGGGIAGLAAAVACLQRGHEVSLYEAAPHLGGRCRSYYDSTLEAEVDNGTHAVLGNNHNLMRYLAAVGSRDSLISTPLSGLDFADVRTGRRWRFHPLRPPPSTRISDLLSAYRLFNARPAGIAATTLSPTPEAARVLWEPLCTSALNTPLAEASAALLSRVVKAMALPGGLWRGLKIPARSMNQSYIDPAAAFIQRHGGHIHVTTPARGIETSDARAMSLVLEGRHIDLGAADAVILAVPPWAPILQRFAIPELATSPIVHAHFRPPHPPPAMHDMQFMGLVGGQAQWLLQRAGILSVTVSAANAQLDPESEQIAAALWAEVAPVIGQVGTPLPPHRIIKERRATLRHTPAVEALRPGPRTKLANVFLAGDWTATGLPCTLESAATSGLAAAQLVPI
ncbi:MAG: hydroxysqualene dehydroxylase HpnE [Rhodospirillaceae bacterium]|nr:hydroxysqualene dehydroxylase HpnE [Rhodospirillaceae bacterium]